jgi:Fur family ferric uptake transcriptional regulator
VIVRCPVPPARRYAERSPAEAQKDGRIPISDLLERLRDRNWRVTSQRRAVAEVLDGEHVHLSAEAIHSRAQKRLPELSMATVYNTLNELVAMGEILEVSVGAGAKRYDPNVSVPHHHLVCTGCGSLRDVRPGEAQTETLQPEEAYGFEITGVDIVFRGLCPDCRAAAG